MTEPTSHVELEIRRRIQAQRVKVQAAKQRRDELSAARRRGLAARYANKLANLRDAEQRRLDAEHDGRAATGENSPVPETVLSLDGRERPATRPAPDLDEDGGQDDGEQLLDD